MTEKETAKLDESCTTWGPERPRTSFEEETAAGMLLLDCENERDSWITSTTTYLDKIMRSYHHYCGYQQRTLMRKLTTAINRNIVLLLFLSIRFPITWMFYYYMMTLRFDNLNHFVMWYYHVMQKDALLDHIVYWTFAPVLKKILLTPSVFPWTSSALLQIHRKLFLMKCWDWK